MSNLNPEERANAVRQALFAGNKIQAIKCYREQTGSGLKDAKEAVEKLEAELRASSPELFTKSANKGCTTIILAGAVFGGLVYFLLP